jgi:membrane fusion protein, multidrug efflux system
MPPRLAYPLQCDTFGRTLPGLNVPKYMNIKFLRTFLCLAWIVFTIAFLLASCGGDKTSREKKTPPPQHFEMLTLGPRSVTTYNDFPATIEGIEIVQLRPMVDGYLEKIYVPEGANVTKGQLLFKIKNPVYDESVVTAQASIRIAQADVDAAKMNVEKVRPLVEKDIVSKYELESAQYSLQSKMAALEQANAALRNAQTNVGYTTLRSPITGIMGPIPYKIGDLISSSTASALTSLARIDKVYAYFALSEKQLLGFSNRIPGATLQDKLDRLPPVSLVLADGSQYPQKGKLQTASGFVTTGTGTVSFKAQFVNPTGLIHSGASAIVRIPRTVDTALLIPQTATYELQDKRFVYLLIDSNRIISTPITSTPTNDGKFLIAQTGLKRGDRVLLNGLNLKDSTVIVPKPVNADSLYAQMQP